MIFVEKTSPQIEILKYMAALFMLVDHVGVLFYPHVYEFRMFGRMAYPLFGYVLVHNYIYFSKDKTAFIRKLLLFALFYEPLHYFVFADVYSGISIFFMYADTLMFFYILETKKMPAFLAFVVFFIPSFFIEYSFFGYLLLIAFYFSFKKNNFFYVFLVLLFSWFLDYPSVVYSLSTLPYLLIIYLVSKINITVYRNKLFFYTFYPVHLILLKLLDFLI